MGISTLDPKEDALMEICAHCELKPCPYNEHGDYENCQRCKAALDALFKEEA